MKRFLALTVCGAALYLPVSAAFATDEKAAPPPAAEKPDHTAHWGYMAGPSGPQNWGNLDSSFAACKMGENQSPVNLEGGQDIDLPALELAYNATPLFVVNNGHTVMQNYAPGSIMKVGGTKEYELVQFHFHTPSEHLIRGMAAPMEAHFVHKDKDGQLAVLAVMVRVGRVNDSLTKIWDMTPPAGESRNSDQVGINARNLLPQNLDYYRYDGSLTTPPCTEGVKWYVLKTPVEISEDQLRAFRELFPVNARPVQPMGNRGFFE